MQTGGTPVAKACQLAASLRADAADILQTLPETQRLDFVTLSLMLSGVTLCESNEGLQQTQLKSRRRKCRNSPELATDVERLSHLAFSDCPTEGALVFCYEIQRQPSEATRKGQTPHTGNQRIGRRAQVWAVRRQMRKLANKGVESLMSQKADGKKTLKCWTCGRGRGICREAAGHARR
ncbi:hypothetical protein TNCV_4192181 [Trichonephila clavipes]|nr:hypothetical protein TNCV_4192181 [Trichonephila clavipes]